MHSNERSLVLARFDANRRLSRRLFDCVKPEAYLDQPIPLRNPIVFYEGHFSAFNFITLVQRALGGPPIDERLEKLFERGIDPEDETGADSSAVRWPARDQVLEYVSSADARVRSALENATLTDDSNPLLHRSEAVFTCLEHELLHHETLLYMFHRLPYERKIPDDAATIVAAGDPPPSASLKIPPGRATLGASRDEIRFGWDNEFERIDLDVPEFEIDVHSVTNRDFLEFVDAGGYRERSHWTEESWAWRESQGLDHPLFWERHDDQWMWRGMWNLIPLPPSWPVWVSHAEASAYCRWKDARLMTEAEYHRAAYGSPDGIERPHPWGDAPAGPHHGNFDFRSTEPMPAGSHPEGASAWGVHDLVGNGWEWTSTEFAPFGGFREMASYPPYSSDFFDGKHYVMKGASPATSRHLVRRTFRNWFRWNYPYMYAKFRCAR